MSSEIIINNFFYLYTLHIILYQKLTYFSCVHTYCIWNIPTHTYIHIRDAKLFKIFVERIRFPSAIISVNVATVPPNNLLSVFNRVAVATTSVSFCFRSTVSFFCFCHGSQITRQYVSRGIYHKQFFNYYYYYYYSLCLFSCFRLLRAFCVFFRSILNLNRKSKTKFLTIAFICL